MKLKEDLEELKSKISSAKKARSVVESLISKCERRIEALLTKKEQEESSDDYQGGE